MKRLCCVYLLCGLFFCGVCFADEGFTVNTIAYGINGFVSVAVDINNSPLVTTSTSDYPSRILLINQTAAGYEVNEINDVSGYWPKLRITSNNDLSLAFFGSAGQGLWYVTKGSWFDWIFSQVDDKGYSDVDNFDMGLTVNDIPHIAYIYQERIYHAFYDVHSQQWIEEELSGFGYHAFTTISIDAASDGRILISCSEESNIRTAVYSNGYWNYLPLLFGYRADGAFTSDGLPAVAFESSELTYAVYINEIIGWVETPVSTFVPWGYCSLAQSSTGVPGIAYIDNDKLMYATNIAGGWTTVQIDERGWYPNLIFDHNNKPLIAYSSYDYCLGTLVIKLAGISLEPFNIADLNKDGIVNLYDFAILANYWMTILPQPDLAIGDFDQNAKVDVLDLKWLGCNWLWQGE